MTHEKHPDEIATFENGSSYPQTLTDWRAKAAELEAQRDIVKAAFEEVGIKPADDPSYTHLLGKLSLVHDQIFAREIETLKEF